MDISFGSKRVCLNIFNANVESIGDQHISFAEVDEDVDEVTREVITSIFSFCIPDYDPKVVTDADDVAMYITSFRDSFNEFILASSYYLGSKERKAEYGIIATTTTICIGLDFVLHLSHYRLWRWS